MKSFHNERDKKMQLHKIVIAGILICVLSLAFAGDDGDGAEQQSDVDYWLNKAATQPASKSKTKTPTTVPTDSGDGFSRDDAICGVVELSDDTQLGGGVFTTRNKPWIVWVASEKRWRLIPPAAVLSITAVVVEEKLELQWRWKATGEPEKVYTGERYPFRRFEWKFHLADDTYIQGVVKGQPIWIETPDKTRGPFVLGERTKGKVGQSLQNLIYIKKVVLSRKMMEKVKQEQAAGTRQ
ncbi:MAG: hypothetical protein KAR11_00625 [Phycisphaerae bacterium]|nr:hypothetical protein [Phycisphaerae bacterium]